MKIIPGLFNQTLDSFLLQHVVAQGGKQISFVNIDMDLYSGAFYVLERILPHLSSGAVIHFHDFFNAFNSCHSDEMRALFDVMFNNSPFGKDRPSSIQLQMMPFETGGFREPLVFRVI